MGDRLGTPGAVGFFAFSVSFYDIIYFCWQELPKNEFS
jgi:hypothetical protein